MTSAINDLLIRRGLITPTYEPRKITNEDKQIEKLAKAVGKEFSKALATFRVNEVNNAFLAEMRAYEATRWNTNNQHCHACYEYEKANRLHMGDSHIAQVSSNISDYYNELSTLYESVNSYRSTRSEGFLSPALSRNSYNTW